MEAMVLALVTPAFALPGDSKGNIGGGTPEDAFIGGGTPDDKECTTNFETCHGSGGGIAFSCDQETGECTTSTQGGGGRATQEYICDEVTGECNILTGNYSHSGGTGGYSTIDYDENGQPIQQGGGYGTNCEGNFFAGESDCVGKGFTGGPA